LKPENLKPETDLDPTPHSPGFRNLVHFGAFVLFAPVLGALADTRNHVANGRWIVVGFLLVITFLNIVVLPHLASGKSITRPGEKLIGGLRLYPFSLALCFAFFPPFAALGAWAAMAAGDAAASAAGRHVPSPRLNWNKDKSWIGLLAFAIAAFPACWLAIYWCPSEQFQKTDFSPELPFVWTLSVLAAASGAILECLEGPFDDNLRVPLGVATVLYLSGMFLSYSTRGLPRETHVQPEHFVTALAVNGALGLAILAVGFVDLPGVLAGVVIGTLSYFFTHQQGYALLLLFVVGGSALSKLGIKRKRELNVEEARGGKRGVGNVLANLFVPAMCCLLYPLTKGHPALLIAYAGALAAAFADTASSEIGVLSSKSPRLLTTLKPVPHGTDGAISSLGLIAALIASGGLAALGWRAGFYALLIDDRFNTTKYRILAALIVTSAGIAGTLFDSLLGATVENKIPGVGKGAVNLACTLAGAVVAGGLTWAFL